MQLSIITNQRNDEDLIGYMAGKITPTKIKEVQNKLVEIFTR
jgi:hypothetical protein